MGSNKEKKPWTNVCKKTNKNLSKEVKKITFASPILVLSQVNNVIMHQKYFSILGAPISFSPTTVQCTSTY